MQKKKESAPSSWTTADAEVGEKILEQIKIKIDPNVVPDRHTQVARVAGPECLNLLLKGQRFENLKPEVKSYLEFVWRVEGTKNLTSAKKEWNDLFESDPDEYVRRANLDGSSEADAELPETATH